MIVMVVDPGGISERTLNGRPDPGGDGATGVVIFEPVSPLEINVLAWREIRDRMEFLRWAQMQRKIGGVKKCVCEAYVPRAGIRTWEADPLYIIGTLDFMFGGEMDLQLVGNAKQWGTDAKIRPYIQGDNAVGRGGGDHALMALRHGLLWTGTKWDGTS